MPPARTSREVVPPPAPTSPRITRPHLLNAAAATHKDHHSSSAGTGATANAAGTTAGNSNSHNNRSSHARSGALSARTRSSQQQQQQSQHQQRQSKQEAAAVDAIVKKALTTGLLAYLKDPDPPPPPKNPGQAEVGLGPGQCSGDVGLDAEAKVEGASGVAALDDVLDEEYDDDDGCYLVESLDSPRSEKALMTELEEAYAPPRQPQNPRPQFGRGSHDRRLVNNRPKQRHLEPIGLWKSLPPPVQPTPSYPSWRAPVPEDDLTAHLLLHRLHTQAQANLSNNTTATTTATTATTLAASNGALAGGLGSGPIEPLPPLTGLKAASRNGRSWRPSGGSRHSPMMQGEAYAPASHEGTRGAGDLPKLKNLQGAPKKTSALHLYRQRPYSLPPDPSASRRKHAASVAPSASPETARQMSPGAPESPDPTRASASAQDLGEVEEPDLDPTSEAMEPWRHRLADEALRFARASDLPHSALRNRRGGGAGLT